MNKKIGLGKGLGALLPGSDEASITSGLIEAPVRAVVPNPHQPRTQFDEQALRELADSIREHGLIQPLIVTRTGEDHYTLIAGERRWRAAQLAGLETVPVVIKDVAPQQMLEMALVENVQRSDLNPLEEALAYKHLSEEFGLTQDQIAQRVGKSRVAVANTMRLLKLPEAIKARLADGLITEGHARALLTITDAAVQQRLLSQIVKNGLSVRQTEELVRRLLEDHPATKKTQSSAAHPRSSGADTRALEERMRRALGTKVILSRSKKGGTIMIHFYSEEELDAIYRRIVS
ncbi:MAG TPA: ParB/RepB/Spo0J family partition protein [Anaerolineae bacterium]|nr:ParB/RepB/Spo0J family partition protein [Anaerolineae bacterium]